MSDIRLALPSKGRLREQAEAYFAEAGIPIRQAGQRGYTARLDGCEGIEVLLVSASEIAERVLSGEVHLGVTGEDLLREASGDMDAHVHLMFALGFGRADLVVAVPKSWIDVHTMSDLDDVGAHMEARSGSRLRVATKYVRSTRRYFAEAGVAHYRIVQSAGATEGAPAAGSAEIVVDITTTGATLENNGLRVLDDGLILKSQAHLAASLQAAWTAQALAALRHLTDCLNARRDAKRYARLSFAGDGADLGDLTTSLGLEIRSPGEALCRTERATDAARQIAARGRGPVLVSGADFVFRAESAEYAAFCRRLGARSEG
jgi:ATP phosphoribosyltransferase